MIGKAFSNYKIIDKIGEGGMGVVYKAEDTRLQRIVALKFISSKIAAHRDGEVRFIREARAAAALNHPNICSVHTIDEFKGQIYISMAYIEGETLKNIINREPIQCEKAIDIAVQVAEGLNEAHKKGIVHRDIKSSNVMITPEGRAIIMDFGLAKSMEMTQVTASGASMGTLEYMSPEQARGEEVDFRSDIWSLGVVIYEILYGRLPFIGNNAQAVLFKIVGDEKPSYRIKENIIPQELIKILKKALSKKLDDRYQSISNMLSDLRRLKIDHPYTGTRTLLNIPDGNVKRRFSFKYAAIITLILFIVISAYFLLIRKPKISSFENSLAVLPLKDLSQNSDQEYFCDGMTEQIITNLSRIPELKVIARTSVMPYKKVEKDIRRIAEELDVEYIVEGSIQKAGDEIRVNAQLIKADDGSHIWADKYDRKFNDIFALQDDVSQAIAGALKVTFDKKIEKSINSRLPTNPKAYDYYMQAKYYIESTYVKTHSEADFQKAYKLVNQSIELDPTYAMGYIALAYLYEQRRMITGEDEAYNKECEYTRKAHHLNPNLAETNSAMAYISMNDNKYEEAHKYLKRAFEIDIKDFVTMHMAGLFKVALGQYYQAMKYYRRAIELDPNGMISQTGYNYCLIAVGEVDLAVKELEQVNKKHPGFVFSNTRYIITLIARKNYKKAEELIDKFKSINPGEAKTLKSWLLAARGKKVEALELNKDSVETYALLGMKDEAIKLLKNSIKGKPDNYLWTYNYLKLSYHPFYKKLLDDPRYQAILKKLENIYFEYAEKYPLPLDN